MRTFRFFVLAAGVVLSSSFCFSQAPNYQWAKSFGNSGEEGAMDVCCDALGNSFVCGYFYSPTINLGVTTLINYDASGATPDLFIAKYDPLGNLLWAKSGGMQYDDAAWGVACDPSGNLLVTGYFRGPYVVFDSDTLYSTTPGFADVFVVKYDSSGNVIWAKGAGGSGFDGGRDVCSDAAGNVFISGWFDQSGASFGSVSLIGAGNWDAFLAKFDASGNVLWARSAGGLDDDRSYGITVDASGNCVITGIFRSDTCFFGTTPLVGSVLSNIYDSYVAKYDNLGNLLWAQSVASSRNELGYGIACDPMGNVFSSGIFQDSGPYFGGPLYAGSYNHTFLYKQDPAGNPLWLKVFQNDASTGYRVVCDGAGSVFLGGKFLSDSMIVDSDTLFKVSAVGDFDFFVAKFDGAGNVLWSKNGGGDGDAGLGGIALNADGTLIGAGGFICDTMTLGATTLSDSPGTGSDLFIFKLDASTAGLAEPSNSTSTLIFPNPFTEFTNVEMSGLPRKNTNLVVYDISGRELRRQTLVQQRTTFVSNSLAAGIYLYQIVDEKEVISSGKLVIQ